MPTVNADHYLNPLIKVIKMVTGETIRLVSNAFDHSPLLRLSFNL